MMRIGLVGCVKSKRNEPAAASALYTSPLFKGRREAVEETCDAWYVLSAKHGLIAPEEKVHPYDETLVGARTSRKRSWSEQVLRQLTDELEDLSEMIFEIHAGNDYCNYGLEQGLVEAGAEVERPVEGLRQGEQLAYYSRRAWREL